MGHHYLPRRLLRGFSQDDCLWMFDKKNERPPKHLRIASVAQEPDMYSQELEDRLNNEIEQPFNAILERMDQGAGIQAADVKTIAAYVLSMYRRVPTARARSRQAIPDVIGQVEQATLQRIDLLEQLEPSERELAEKGRENIAQIFSKIRAEDQDWLWQGTLMPEMLPRVRALLEQMTWQRWRIPPGRQLLIGDSPLLFDEAKGLANQDAEMIFPLRSDTALVATWRRGPQGEERAMTVQQTRMINSRTIARADRWVFSQRNEPWILPLVRDYPV